MPVLSDALAQQEPNDRILSRIQNHQSTMLQWPYDSNSSYSYDTLFDSVSMMNNIIIILFSL